MKKATTLALGAALMLLPVIWGQQTTAPNTQAPKASAGCGSEPVKKPKFHIPTKLQKAISKQASKLNNTTGIQADPNAPEKAVDDAQKDKPCESKPAAAAPASAPANTAPAKQ